MGQGAYPGNGLPLRQMLSSGSIVSTNAEFLSYPITTIIADNRESEGIPINDASQVSFFIKYDDTPTGDTIIEHATNLQFTDAETLDTITASSAKLEEWVRTISGQKFLRVKNTSNVNLEVWAQKTLIY